MWFFTSWSDLARVAVVGFCAYVGLIALLRLSGKRTLSKLNAFDLVVTVALGSILATILLSKDVALAEGLTAFALLIALQYVIAWSALRSAQVRRLVKSDPRLLFYRGEFIEHALHQERVMRAEVLAAMRSQGIAQLDQVAAVVLETDGSMTVVASPDQGSVTVLTSVDGVP